MRRRAPLLLPLLLPLSLAATAVAGPVSPSAPPRARQGEDKIDAALARRLRAGGTASFLVVLADQADVRPPLPVADRAVADDRAAAALSRRREESSARGWRVFRALRDQADRTQAGVIARLRQAGAPYRPFWVANVIQTEGDLALARALSERPDVRALESNAEAPGIEPPAIAGPGLTDVTLANGPEWGIKAIHADAVWDLGFTGDGIVVAGADTGIQWNHPALLSHYRGWDGKEVSHDYNWHDSIHDAKNNTCGNNSLAPCDDNSHGTHTVGTVAGDDGQGNQIGVAPGARWIGCRNMDRGAGTPARYIECFQFFLAPTNRLDQEPNPDLRPHVVNNSWGCPSSEGCAPLSMQLVIENVSAAGVFVEVSAGNAGPACGTVNDPPAIYDVSFATGAIDVNGRLAGFSSRGAVALDGSGRLKPDVVAPGVGVRSCVPGGRYAAYSGTSMAGPHVVGVVALLWSARPELVRDIERTRDILRATAVPDVGLAPQLCGGITSDFYPNHSVGYGRVDVLRAVKY